MWHVYIWGLSMDAWNSRFPMFSPLRLWKMWGDQMQTIQIFSMYWAVSVWLEVRWCQLQFMKKLFWSQPKIIDQSHCFQLWAKLRNAAPVRGFITTSNSQLLLYNTDSCVPLRVLRNFCLYSIQSWEALDKNKQTDIFCQGFQHRWSCHSF